MESIIKRQEEIFEAIRQVKVNFNKDSASRKTPEYIQKRIETIQNLWGEFDHNNSALLEYEQSSDDEYFKNKIHDKARVLFLEIYEKLKSFKPSISADSKIPVSNPLADLLSKQNTNFRAFKRLLKGINFDLLSEKWEIEDELRNLQSKWNAIDILHLDIDNITKGYNEDYEAEFNDHEVLFKDMKRKLNQKLSSTSHIQHSTPQLEIPIFTGSYVHWPTFSDLFTAAIHNNNLLTKSQKMQHLKGKVKGEAERLIHHLHISEENYDTAWEILVHRYNNPQLIFTKQIEILLNQPNVQRQTASDIKRLHDVTAECIHAIHNLGVDTNSWDPLIVHLISKKLDPETFSEYKEARENPRELPTLTEFMNFIEGKFIALEPIHRRERDSPKYNQLQSPIKRYYHSEKYHQPQNVNKRYPSYPIHQKQPSYPKKFENYQSNATYTRHCPFCNRKHDLFQCDKFDSLTPDAKINTISKLKVCKNCLYHHFNNVCISLKRCKHCNGEHNSKLHDAFAQSTEIPTCSNFNTAQKQAIKNKTINHIPQNQFNAHHIRQKEEEILLTTILVQIKSHDGNFITLRALLDQGSQVSLITERAAQLLQLPRNKHYASVSGIGHESKQSRGTILLECKSIYNNYEFSTKALIISSLISNLPNISFYKQSWPHLEHLTLADPEYNLSKPIDLLLGAEVYSEIIADGLIKGPPHAPIAQRTRLGWILSGNVRTFHCNVIINELSDLSKYWEMEDVNTSTAELSSDDQYCEDFYKATTVRLENGKYQVSLPMKPGFENRLGKSKSKAFAQFKQLECKMMSKPAFAESYKAFIREYEELGHMRLVPTTSEISYYLPHHGVEKPDSTTTKLRVVFNASAETSTGKSLNDLMLRGPNLQQDLLTLIVKWRQYNYVITADIEKAFRNLLVNESQQNLQRILWRESPKTQVQEYCLTTVTYGTKAAPYLTMRTLKQLATDDGEKYPLAAQELKQSFFMDDLLSGENCLSSAKLLVSQLINILQGAGMNLRKWSSNEPMILSDLAEDKLNSTFEFKCQESRKTLGLQWNPKEDTFTYKNILNNKLPSKQTKRQVLAEISQIFDPLGWLSPITIRAKLFFQHLWKQEISWDDELSDDYQKEWLQIRHDLNSISQFIIPRQVGNTENSITLHGFADASERAYACTIFLVSYHKGEHTSRILAAKTKVAPLNKKISLPRLELCAAVLLSELMKKIKEALITDNVTTYAWTDSMVVLGWLKGDESKWKQFVATRTQRINEVIPASNWYHVSTKDNAADCASRGISATQLQEHHLWWTGPKWLLNFKPECIPNIDYKTPEIEIKKSVHVNVAVQSERSETLINNLLNNYSSITRAARVLTWVLRFIERVRGDRNKTPRSTFSEINNAYNLIIKTVQKQDFEKELKNIIKLGHVGKNSKILNLNPFIDNNGILRVGGRLNKSNISSNAKHPIILSNKCRLTELIINKAHLATLHGGPKLTLSHIREQFWIISGLRTVKKHLRNCVTCKRFSGEKRYQIMADLPEPRVNPSRPFTHTGVDFTGHVELKANKGRGIKTLKGYIAVFICLTTKAVHLELVSDLSTQGFLAAFRRFISRRGAPRHVYSDNGTNFVGANRLLQSEYKQIINSIDTQFFNKIQDMNIEWHFNAPAWPNAGGLWEAAVKSTKHHLLRVIGHQKLTYEEFCTLLHQIEACLNSRPLCSITENAEDEILTPGHFLIGGPLLSRPQTETENINITQRWSMVQNLNKQFWKAWSREYLQQLQTRSKWTTPTSNLKLNDVVLVKEENLPPGKWALGKVCALHPGQDGYVRVVSLKIKNNIIKRPINKLVLLPVHNNLPQNSEHQQLHNNNNIPQESSQQASVNNTRATRRTTGRAGANTLHKIFYTFMLFTCILPSYQESIQSNPYNISMLPENQTLYFDKTSDLMYIRDDWKLVIYYNMTSYWQGISNIRNYITHIKELCMDTKYQNTQYITLALQLEQQLNDIDHYNSLLQRNTHSRRQRRGFFNGVGYAANALFGTLDDRFAQQYERDIEKIKRNENHLQTLIKYQTSIIEAEHNIIQRNEKNMNQQFEIIRQYINNITQETNKVQISTNNNIYIISSTLSANVILGNLRRIQSTLLNTVTDISNGRLDTRLLSLEQLQHELDIIAGQISSDLTLPVRDNILDIYKLLRVFTRVTNKYLIIEVKIPIVSNEVFELDRLLSIPQKQNQHMYQIITAVSYIAYNLRKDIALFLTDNDLRQCFELPTSLLCHLTQPFYDIKAEQSLCNIKLLNPERKLNNELSLCKPLTTICKQTWLKLQADNTWIFMCCEECNVRILCPTGVTMIKLNDRGIIKIGQGCTLKSNEITLFAHNHFLNQIDINQPLSVSKVSMLNNIMKDTSFNFTNLESHEENFHQIKQQINELKEQAESKFTVHENHHYATYGFYTIVIVIILPGAGWLLLRRLRSRSRRESSNQQQSQQRSQAGPGPGAEVPNTITLGDIGSASEVVVASVPRVNPRRKQSIASESVEVPKLTRFRLDDEI